MSGFDSLMNEIASEFSIFQGQNESDANWYARVIYSLTSRMGYASLWDFEENSKRCSIFHFKKRMENILDAYIGMYPQVNHLFCETGQENKESIIDFIYNIFLQTGNLYHSPNYVFPAIPRGAQAGSVVFTRGMAIEKKQKVSGAGTYEISPVDCAPADVIDMFGLHKTPLKDRWYSLISNISNWNFLDSRRTIEYLRTDIRKRRGAAYWKLDPEKTGEISLAREKQLSGPYMYYFYRDNHQVLEFSPIPSFLADDISFLQNSCLAYRNALPASFYKDNGQIVSLKIGYNLPKAERNWVKLYSWPETFTNINSPFSRIMSKEVFSGIRPVLQSIGLNFIKK